MGHLAGKDVYLGLARKLDSLWVRTPYNDAFRALLVELYTPREAELIAAMPPTPTPLEALEELVGFERVELSRLLEGLCEKGLVIDLFDAQHDRTTYQISPFVVGIFEFTMMRTASDDDHRRRARLFREYWKTFLDANHADGQMSMLRALPHESTLPSDDHVEVLDHERASELVAEHELFAVGTCSCRHERHHLGDKDCDVPLETCTSMGTAADYLIRRNLARSIPKAEMLERLDQSRRMGLALLADNVQNRIGFICHCCACCCNVLGAVSRHGYPNAVVSSNYVAAPKRDACNGCAKCAKACPIDAIEMRLPRADAKKKEQRPSVSNACIGCGVCVVACPSGAMQMKERPQRVFHPANTFERVLVQALQAGTLQNLIFDNPQSRAQGFARAFLGGFLRLDPVKRALVGERFRSTFLRRMSAAAEKRAGGTDV
jgi:ferredoxin